MFQNAAIDIAIGLVLMYLVLSLLCTVINEFIATRLNLRSKNLAAGLQEILDDPVVRNAFYDHGLISATRQALKSSKSLKWSTPTQKSTSSSIVADAPAVASAIRDAAALPSALTADAPGSSVAAPAQAPVAEIHTSNHPSYLSAETFTLALVGSLTGTRLAPGRATPSFADVQGSIERLPASKIKSALQASLMSAEGKYDAFRRSVTTWFDDSMERLSGAYKRHLKAISILVGCAVAIVVNADTFAAGRALWSDSSLRSQMVQVSEARVKSGPSQPTPAQTPSDVANAFKATDQTLRPLPIGWPMHDSPCERLSGMSGAAKVEGWIVFLITTAAGWFVTGLALSLGAPFWFDLLSKFINIRGAGVKPKRQDAKG